MSQNTLCVADIRRLFADRLQTGQIVGLNREGSMTQLVGSTTLEIVGASFIADEDSIFGQVNWDYVRREEEWYNSQSLNVNDIPGGTPQIWKAVADPDGFINSNYGWAIYSTENGSQFERAVAELKKNPDSRRASMIYTRPQMWDDYNKNGRSDFMCLRGDVIVNSPEGDLPIKDVVGKISMLGKWPVYSVNFKTGEREIAWATRGEKTGKKKLVRVHLDNGTFIDTTTDHKFFTKNKIGGAWNYGIEVAASDLKPGTSLIDLMLYKNGNGLCFKSTLAGEFSFDKRKIVHREYYKFATGEDISGYHIHHINENPKDNSFLNLQKMQPSEHLKWHITGRNNPVFKIKDRQNQISRMIETYEQTVSSRDISWYEQRNKITLKECLELAQDWFSDPTRASLRKFKKNLKQNKNTRVMAVLSAASKLSGVHILKMIYQNTKVLFVEQLSTIDDVYDIEVPGNHNFFIGSGVLVHNCTNDAQYLVRDNKVHAVVQMRSNDAWAGYRNDRAWQAHVLNSVGAEIGIEPGNLYWQVSSLHIYARQYYLVHHFMSTGETHISKDEYTERYPNSPYL